MLATVMRRVLAVAIVMAVLACGASSEAGPYYAGWTVGDARDGYGTILRSTDSGNTWTRQGAGQIANVDLADVVAVDPYTAWVVGKSDGDYATIYHTTDGGSTWGRKGSSDTGSPDYVPEVELLKVHAVGDNVWAVGNGAILHTSDGGVTWTSQIPAGYEGIPLQGVYTPDGETVWVTGGPKDSYATILKSTNAGQDWTRQSGSDVIHADHILGIAAADANTAWAVGGATPAAGGDYFAMHTTDGGATWTRQVGVQGLWDANEVYALSTSVVWAACDHGVFWSTNGGKNWDDSASHGHALGPYTMGISAVSSQEAWAVRSSYDGSIYHTADGGSTWTTLDELGGEQLPSLGAVSFSTQPIPEPSTLALLGLGGLLLMLFGLRRRK